MSKPRYNRAFPWRGVTYQWFSFISVMNVAGGVGEVRGGWPSRKTLSEKKVVFKRERKIFLKKNKQRSKQERNVAFENQMRKNRETEKGEKILKTSPL